MSMTSRAGRYDDVRTTSLERGQSDCRQQVVLPRAPPAVDSSVAQTDPPTFAAVLIGRLLLLKSALLQRQQRKLAAADSAAEKPPSTTTGPLPTAAAETADGIGGRLRPESRTLSLLSARVRLDDCGASDNDDAQSILEQHLSRIWDSSDDVVGLRPPPPPPSSSAASAAAATADDPRRRRSDPTHNAAAAGRHFVSTLSDEDDFGTVPCADREADAALCDAVCRLDTRRDDIDEREDSVGKSSSSSSSSSASSSYSRASSSSDACAWSSDGGRSRALTTSRRRPQCIGSSVRRTHVDEKSTIWAYCRPERGSLCVKVASKDNHQSRFSNNSTSYADQTNHLRVNNSSSSTADVLVVGYFFCDDPIPYRTTVSGRVLTLGQFKQLLSKRGQFRYFFKKPCDEFDCGVVNEEVTGDDEILPTWQGKIVGKIEQKLAA